MKNCFKSIRRLKLKIFSLVALVTLLTLELSPFAVKATDNQLQFYAAAIKPVGYDSYNGKNVWFSNATLGGQTAYCIDYTCPAPSGTMTVRGLLSDQGMAILIHGYPNSTPAQMGVNDADEAYMATQMALWEVLNDTGESLKSGLKFRVENVTPKAGLEGFYQRTTAAAARLVAMAKANPYTDVPTMYIDNGNVGYKDFADGDVLIGPYTVTISGNNGSTIRSIRASLENAPASAYVTDGNGNAKSNLVSGDTVYIRMNKSEGSKNFNIKFDADVDRKVGVIYTKPGQSVQDYVMLSTEPTSMSKSLEIRWTKKNTKGEIQLVKVDQDEQPVKGVTFNLTSASGSFIGELTTGSDGRISFYNVPEGDYVLTEVSAPEGYVIKTKTQNIKVVADQVTNVKFVNERITGKLVITKVDDANNKLANVEFKIYDENKSYVDTVVTDENGMATVNLDYGTYYFKETKAPAGYIMDEKIYEFSVTNENRLYNATITNQRYKGSLIIVKTDENNTPLQGVKFNILDDKGNVIKTITTNENGLAGIKNIPLGTYYYQEIEAPENVVIDREKHEFKIEENNQVIRKDIVNEKIKGQLKVTKVDNNNEVIANAKFEIIDSNNVVVDTITTDSNGVAISKELPKGTYTYREIYVPEKYVLDSTVKEFKIDTNNQVVNEKVVNFVAAGSLKIVKVDENGKALANVKFEVYNESGEVVDTLVTDAQGKATSKDLPLGNYTYKEVEVPDGVVLDSTVKTFALTTNGQVITKTIVNEYIDGKLRIIKVDENDKPLAGVKFNILDSNKNVIETIVTDNAGIAASGELRKGTYYFQEIEAPYGIIVDNTVYEFKIEYDNQNVIKNLVNRYAKGNLVITKYDSTGALLSNVKFQILNEAKEVVETIVTDENGVAESSRLVIGKYYFREISAPDHVVMDTKIHEFVLNQDNQVVSKTVINKVKEGSLKIIKVDENNKPLAGIKFNIYDENKNLIDSMTTNENGVAESGNLVKGKYFYQEVEAPFGIIVDDTMYDFEIVEDGQNVVRNMINYYAKGQLQITKYDNKNNTLAGVKFEIANAEGKVVDTITTDANGKATSVRLPLGTYTYKEVSAPSDYVMDNATYEFKLEYNNQVVTKEVINKVKEGFLKIIKVDENNKPLEGVKFNIYDENKNLVDTMTTNKDGVAESGNLVKGKYFYQEVAAPEGIIVDSTMYPFEIVEDGQNVVKNMINYYAKGQLQITKYDSKNNKLEGVKFEIANAKGEVVETITTDVNGKAISKKLPLGTYTYKEVSAPSNVVMDKDAHEFVLDKNNQVVTKEIVNKVIEGKLKIIKVDENSEPLEGIKFNIYDENKQLVDTIVTDKDGVARSKELEKGKYYYQEIEAPEGIIVDNNMYAFEIVTDGQNVIANMVNYYAKGQLQITKYDSKNKTLAGVKFEIYNAEGKVVDTLTTDENGKATSQKLMLGTYTYKEVEAPDHVVMDSATHEFKLTENNQVVTKEVVNKIKEGKLKIIKVDENDIPLEGVKFNIYDENKNLVDTMTTDKNGVAESGNLEKGKYFYQEVEAPEGIVVDDTMYPFEIVEDGQNVIENMVNYYAKGELQITKIDNKKHTLEGVKFEIANDKGEVVDTIVTNAKGIATTKKLPLGTYTYKEVEAPSNVVMDSEAHEFALTYNNEVVKKTVTNKVKEATLKIIKVDENEVPLQGVTFDIYTEDMKFVQRIVTDENGVAESKNLEMGKYYYKEVKAPQGIKVDDTLYAFEIVEDGQNVIENMVNYYIRGSFKIYKLAENTNKPLANAEFKIYDEARQEIATLITDEEGIATIDNLVYGTYYFKETKAPNGYKLDNTEYKLEITSEKEVVAVAYNVKDELPKTGSSMSSDTQIILLVAVISILGYTVVTALRKREQF